MAEWQRLGGVALVFLPLTLVFAALTALRRRLYRWKILPAWCAPVPVIVVGNVTVGGTGKTPLVIALVQLLQSQGFTPGVVARGYGRVPRREHDPLGVVRVYPHVATPEHFGDEPVLIARRCNVPVYVSPDRPAAARALLDAHREVDVLVSDDGLQHYALARDIEIAVVDAERLFGNGLLLPSGPLREPVSRLRSVDAIVFSGQDHDPRIVDRAPGPPRFAMHLGNEHFLSVHGNDQRETGDFALAVRGRAVAAVAGIAHPERFFEHLERLGVRARRHPFPDHHAFTPADLKLPGAEVVVMTEKDAVKCGAFADARLWFLRVDAILPAAFEEFLRTRLAAARRGKEHGPETA